MLEDYKGRHLDTAKANNREKSFIYNRKEAQEINLELLQHDGKVRFRFYQMSSSSFNRIMRLIANEKTLL